MMPKYQDKDEPWSNFRSFIGVLVVAVLMAALVCMVVYALPVVLFVLLIIPSFYAIGHVVCKRSEKRLGLLVESKLSKV